MNKLILAVLASLVAANVALAQTAAPAAADKKPAAEKKAEAKKAPSEKQLKQQETMKSCNKEAGEKKLKGDERKKFMSGCLKAGAPAAAKPAEAKASPQRLQNRPLLLLLPHLRSRPRRNRLAALQTRSPWEKQGLRLQRNRKKVFRDHHSSTP